MKLLQLAAWRETTTNCRGMVGLGVLHSSTHAVPMLGLIETLAIALFQDPAQPFCLVSANPYERNAWPRVHFCHSFVSGCTFVMPLWPVPASWPPNQLSNPRYSDYGHWLTSEDTSGALSH